MEANQEDRTNLQYKKTMLGFEMTKFYVRCATGSEMVAGELDSVLATALI